MNTQLSVIFKNLLLNYFYRNLKNRIFADFTNFEPLDEATDD